MHRIVYLDRNSIRAKVRRPGFVHDWVEYGKTPVDEVVLRLKGCSIAISNKVSIDRAAMAALPELKMIAVAATGTNNIDLEAARERGIVVSNIRGYAVNTVPEHVLSMLFALSRNLLAYRASVAAGEWQKSSQFCLFNHPIRDLFGQTLGIIGRGSLGEGVARRAEALGMTVLFAEHKQAATVRPGYTAFAEVLKRADALTLHCPLNADTRHLIGEKEFSAMLSHAILINTARGGLVDEAALAVALKKRVIGGAAFDVLTEEPPVKGNVLLDPDLLALPNFILSPHCAWASEPAMQALSDQLIENIEAFAAGTPRNRVA